MTQVQLIQITKIDHLINTMLQLYNPIKFNSDVRSDFEYYLGRVDKVFLDKEITLKY